jgi:hypothetical protein
MYRSRYMDRTPSIFRRRVGGAWLALRRPPRGWARRSTTAGRDAAGAVAAQRSNGGGLGPVCVAEPLAR